MLKYNFYLYCFICISYENVLYVQQWQDLAGCTVQPQAVLLMATRRQSHLQRLLRQHRLEGVHRMPHCCLHGVHPMAQCCLHCVHPMQPFNACFPPFSTSVGTLHLLCLLILSYFTFLLRFKVTH